MGDCVRIEEYRRTCANCYWHNDAMGACRHPGGWWWDKRYHHCATFRWRNGPPGEKKEKISMKNKNLRRFRCLVTAQTRGNLERLAQMDGCGDVGRMVDKLTRDKMLALRQSVVGPWAAHYVARAKRVD